MLITDYAMPVTNGAQLAKRALSTHPDLPIIIATGYANPDDLREAVGADVAFAREPFDVDELVLLVDWQLEACRLKT